MWCSQAVQLETFCLQLHAARSTLLHGSSSTSGAGAQMQILHFIAVLEIQLWGGGSAVERRRNGVHNVHNVHTVHATALPDEHFIASKDLDFRRLRCIMQLTPFTHFVGIYLTLGKKISSIDAEFFYD